MFALLAIFISCMSNTPCCRVVRNFLFIDREFVIANPLMSWKLLVRLLNVSCFQPMSAFLVDNAKVLDRYQNTKNIVQVFPQSNVTPRGREKRWIVKFTE